MFEVQERINAPVDKVWRHLTDPELISAWMPGIESMRTEDGGPLRQNSRLYFMARGAERTSEVIEYEEASKVSLCSTQGPITATYRYGLSTDGSDTIATLKADCAASGAGKLIAPLVRVLARRADQGQLGALRAMVESVTQA